MSKANNLLKRFRKHIIPDDEMKLEKQKNNEPIMVATPIEPFVLGGKRYSSVRVFYGGFDNLLNEPIYDAVHELRSIALGAR